MIKVIIAIIPFIATVIGCAANSAHNRPDIIEIGLDVYDSDVNFDSADTVDTNNEVTFTDIRDADMDETGPDGKDAGIDPYTWNWEPPDATFVYIPKTPGNTINDEPFTKDMPIPVDNSALGDEKAVNVVAVVDSRIFIGTNQAVFQVIRDGNGFKLKQVTGLNPDNQAVIAITKNPFGQGPCVVSASQIVCSDGKTANLQGDSAILSAAADNAYIYMLTTANLYAWDGRTISQINGLNGQLRAVAVMETDRLAVVSDQGVFVGNNNAWNLLKYGSKELPYTDCQAVASDGKTLIVGCNNGIAREDIDSGVWQHIDSGIGGLPAKGIHSVAMQGDTTAIAYDYGCGAIKNKHFDYYVSHRWLPSDDCLAVAVDTMGNRWFGTDKGLTLVSMQKQTIAQKADFLFDDLKTHFVRMGGFLSPLADVDPNTGTYRLPDSDNDGQWTQEMIGGLCFAYSVTHDKAFKDLAWKAIHNMFLLIDVPAKSFQKKGMKRGFVARSLCREDEPCFAGKENQSNWHLVSYDGKKYYWKDDTSSDEIVGHFFGYSIYYDLCAEEQSEKDAVADHALAIANYIVDNGFRLIDLDGLETEYGHWQPETLAIALDGFGPCVNKYHDVDKCGVAAFGGGWLNSIEILGLLMSAYHISGNTKFFDAFRSLILKYRYWKLAMGNENTFTMTKPMFNNHCDEELAMLSFTTLLRYESDPDRRAYWLACLKWLYTQVRPERNPMHAGITSIFLPQAVDAHSGVQSLREMPARDRRRVEMDNSHRVDAKPIGKDRHKQEQFDRVFPYDEIHTMWWDKNPFLIVADTGAQQVVNGPMAFLIAYWSLRYSGVLK